MNLTNTPGEPVVIQEPPQFTIQHGADTWYWSHNHCYLYVRDDEGELAFTINTTEPTEALVRGGIEAYSKGYAVGKKIGMYAKAAEIRRVLEIQDPAERLK